MDNGEREADEDIRLRRVKEFDSVEELIEELHSEEEMTTRLKHECESCGSVGIESPLCKFRGKLLCGGCIARWLGFDGRLQGQSSFGEMIATKSRQGRKKNTERDAEIKKRRKAGESIKNLATMFNLSKRRIQGIIGGKG